MSDAQEICKRIIELIAKSGLSDREVASRCNLDPTLFSHYRAGTRIRRPRESTVVAIAYALNVSPTEIDPSLKDEFLSSTSWFMDDVEETKGLFERWFHLVQEIESSRIQLLETLRSMQEFQRFLEQDLAKKVEEVDYLCRQITVKTSDMRVRYRELKNLAGQKTKS